MTTRRALAIAAAVLTVGYVVVDMLLQLASPQHSPISDAESNLAIGPLGWVMNLNFVGRGAMSVCLGVAIALTGGRTPARTTGVMLLIAGGACSALLAVFVTDIGVASTPTGITHFVIAAIGFVLALGAITVLTGWARGVLLRQLPLIIAFLAVAWLGFLATVAAALVAPHVIGLLERICLVGILGWAFVVAVSLARLDPRGSPDPVSASHRDGPAPAR